MKLGTFLRFFDNDVQITIIDWSCGPDCASTLVQSVYLGDWKFDSYRDISFYFVFTARIKNGILEIAVTQYGKE